MVKKMKTMYSGSARSSTNAGSNMRGLSKVPLNAIPKPIRRGVALAMAADPTRTHWGAEARHLSREAQTHNWVDDGVNDDVEACDILKEAAKGKEQWHLNARHFSHMLKIIDVEDSLDTHIEWVNEIPPEAPNVYTDGSMTSPTDQSWSRMGAGLW